MLIFSLALCSVLSIESFRFEHGSTEMWYQIPVSDIFPHDSLVSNMRSGEYTYHLLVHEEKSGDSAYTGGTKVVDLVRRQEDDYILDFLPITLYPGHFRYDFVIESEQKKFSYQGRIEIPSDAIRFMISDLVLGTEVGLNRVSFRGFEFMPTITADFKNQPMILSYFEIYGLVPDSQFYDIKYQILPFTDSSSHAKARAVYERKEKRIKFESTQADTALISILNIPDGNYLLKIEVFEPALRMSSKRTKTFTKSTILEPDKMPLYRSIEYLVRPEEFKAFSKLDSKAQEEYLKKFWTSHSYLDFEKTISAVDEKFSNQQLRGRDTERGKFYIKNGPPDEIEVVTMRSWAKPFEVWHYYSKGYDALFCDRKDNNNPVLIKTFRTGELMNILEHEYYDGKGEDWMYEISPGTYDEDKKEGAE